MPALEFVRSNLKAAFRPLNIRDPSGRHNELDGLRGWAALSVILLHQFKYQFGKFIPLIDNPLASFFMDGRFAVCIFFVLSGDALSSSYFTSRNNTAVAKLAIKRYFRLFIPVLTTCLICFLLIKTEIIPTNNIRQDTIIDEIAPRFLATPASIGSYIKYSAIDVFISGNGESQIIPYLWTMKYEILGSYIVFIFLMGYNFFRCAWAVALPFALFGLIGKESSIFSCFIFGAFFSWLRHTEYFQRENRFPIWLKLALIAILVLADGYTSWKGMLWDRKAIFAIPFVFIVWNTPFLCNFLRTDVSKMLGILSFPVYLMQFPVITSYTSLIFCSAIEHGPIDQPLACLMALSSIFVSYLAAALFVPVEVFTKWVGDQTVRLLVVEPKK